ncbi:hypothetical protein KC220_26490, partial [Mycobacterium tuberculosis]|nr:hypothetical protein [Mycobacterium tuberculosis]
MNSIVVVGLYYGFMTTFSIGPSYLFLLRARLWYPKPEAVLIGNWRSASSSDG